MTIPKNSSGTWRKRRYQRIEIFDLEVLVLAAESGSFRGVSAQVGVGQPAVTRRIQKLEDTFGVSLFERSPTGVRLTNAGWRFLCRVRRILSELKLAIADVETAGVGGNGEINFGLTDSLSNGLFHQILSEFFDNHPEVQPNFVQADLGELETLLNHRMIDILYGPVNTSFTDSDILPVANQQIYLAVSHNNGLAARQWVSWADVAGLVLMVGTEDPGPVFEPSVRPGFRKHHDGIKVKRHNLDRKGILNLVEMNLGSTLIWEDPRRIGHNDLIYIPVLEAGVAQRIQYSLKWHAKNDNPALRRFISLARIKAKKNGALS